MADQNDRFEDEFDFEFYMEESPNPQLEEDLRLEALTRLRELAEGHQDIIGASVAVEKPAKKETSFVFQARVVAYVRPENIAAVEKEDSPMAALQSVLDAVERQVRQKRGKLDEPWKRPDMK